uniref:Secreted protein n=1 Tax=Heterorhabditis bacteriophora TaxID=37862 RepID=A0A1I7XEM1_HETBA
MLSKLVYLLALSFLVLAQKERELGIAETGPMSSSASESLVNILDQSNMVIPNGVGSPPSCICGSIPIGSLSANTLADTLGVSPLYKQQEWVFLTV